LPSGNPKSKVIQAVINSPYAGLIVASQTSQVLKTGEVFRNTWLYCTCCNLRNNTVAKLILFKHLIYLLNKTSIINLLLILCLQQTVYSQVVSFSHPNTSNVLSDNYIQSLVIDKNGFLWIGTSDGLNVYDDCSQLFKKIENVKE
jgi:Two component regulator propeller